jgi:DNA-binding transcriptional regulator YiaG/predicted DNA-binding protein YlxM (UPF0122 family)
MQDGKTYMLRNIGGDLRYLTLSISEVLDHSDVKSVIVKTHPNCLLTGAALTLLRNPEGVNPAILERLTEGLKKPKEKFKPLSREDLERQHVLLQDESLGRLRRQEAGQLIVTSEHVKASRIWTPKGERYNLLIGPASVHKYGQITSDAGLDINRTFFLQGKIDDLLRDVEISVKVLNMSVKLMVEHSQHDMMQEVYVKAIISSGILPRGSEIGLVELKGEGQDSYAALLSTPKAFSQPSWEKEKLKRHKPEEFVEARELGMTALEAAKFLDVSPRTVFKWWGKLKIKPVKDGREKVEIGQLKEDIKNGITVAESAEKFKVSSQAILKHYKNIKESLVGDDEVSKDLKIKIDTVIEASKKRRHIIPEIVSKKAPLIKVDTPKKLRIETPVKVEGVNYTINKNVPLTKTPEELNNILAGLDGFNKSDLIETKLKRTRITDLELRIANALELSINETAKILGFNGSTIYRNWERLGLKVIKRLGSRKYRNLGFRKIRSGPSFKVLDEQIDEKLAAKSTIPEMAKEFNVTVEAIRARLKKRNLKSFVSRRKMGLTEQKVKEAHKTAKSSKEAGLMLGISPATYIRHLKSYGLDIVDGRKNRKGKKTDDKTEEENC